MRKKRKSPRKLIPLTFKLSQILIFTITVCSVLACIYVQMNLVKYPTLTNKVALFSTLYCSILLGAQVLYAGTINLKLSIPIADLSVGNLLDLLIYISTLTLLFVVGPLQVIKQLM